MKAPSRIRPFPVNTRKAKRLVVSLSGLGVLLVLLIVLLASAAWLPRLSASAAQNPESIATLAADCLTPKTIFNLGDTVCAVASDALLGPPVQRRFSWVAPNGVVFQAGPDIITDPQSNSIVLPSAGAFAQVGTWTVRTVDVSNNNYAVAQFVVRDPNNAAADLWVQIFGPAQVGAGTQAPFTVYVTNLGPDDAQNVQLTVATATNSTFVSETQSGGPAFSCTNPTAGSTGNSVCTLALLPANTTAVFQYVFQVDAGATEGAEVFCTASVTSATNDALAENNTAIAGATITPQTCEIICPSDITVSKAAGECGAVVNFATPTGGGSNCGTIDCSPPSGTVFPLGVTTVICFGETGAPCGFTVTVQDPQPPTISCPANITVNEAAPGLGFGVVEYAAPTGNDNCALADAICNPPSGSSFPLGTTTVTCQTGSGSGVVTCSFTVTVNSEFCLLDCPDDLSVAESPAGSGSATVNYAAPTALNCSGVTVACTPASGTSFALGTTLVTCTATDASSVVVASCSFNVTVTNNVPCTIVCPANLTVANDADQCGAEVSYASPTTTGNCGDAPSCTPASGSFFPIGTTSVTCVTDAGPQCSFTVTVNDTQAPTLACPANLTAATTAGQCSAVVSFAPPTATDNCPGATVSCSPASGSVFPKGTTTVTCTATDAAGNSGGCSFTVTVNDTQAPSLTCSVTTTSLWPPNHNLVNVGLAGSATDNCSPGATINVAVYSDEDDELESGDGNHSPDAKDIALGTLRLRRERNGNGDGRVYLIIVTATDAAGNVSRCYKTVTVAQSNSSASQSAVAAQAAAALAHAQQFGTPPPNYFVVGDGAIVGPKQ